MPIYFAVCLAEAEKFVGVSATLLVEPELGQGLRLLLKEAEVAEHHTEEAVEAWVEPEGHF